MQPSPATRPLRWLELFLLLGVTPVLFRLTPARLLIPEIVLGAALCLTLLLRDPSFKRASLGWGPAQSAALRRPLLRFALLAPILALGVRVARPDLFLSLPRTRPLMWAFVMVAYPVVSVYPQELIFRTFFFHRYEALFRDQRLCIASGALAFGWAHIVLGSTVSMVMSTVGGLLFASTYARSRSTIVVAIEHALWGCLVFTLGLGIYFYAGVSRGP